MSGLLPPSRWHLGKNRAGLRETERGKYCLGKTEGGIKEIGGSEEEEETYISWAQLRLTPDFTFYLFFWRRHELRQL